MLPVPVAMVALELPPSELPEGRLRTPHEDRQAGTLGSVSQGLVHGRTSPPVGVAGHVLGFPRPVHRLAGALEAPGALRARAALGKLWL
eukprot:8605250-Heterocapsa_arctica.AAC.1